MTSMVMMSMMMTSMTMTSMMMTSMMKTSMLMTRMMKLTRARSRRRGLVPGRVEMEAGYWSHKQALESVSYKQDHTMWKIEQSGT